MQQSESDVRVLLLLPDFERFMTPFVMQTMYQGVVRDDARRSEKMKQREDELRESQRKRELYERVQSVRTQDGT
jgi:hypothetical protein